MNDFPKVIITGASGFIGSELCAYFANKNWNVIGFVRHIPAIRVPNVVYLEYDLIKEVNETIFPDTDFLIHCAYIKNDIEKNVQAARNILSVSKKFKVKKNIFISSLSAFHNAVSKYGKQKFEIEKLFSSKNDCNIRTGVVLGNGGLFRQMSEYVKAGKRIPLINGGNQPLQTIHIHDLLSIVEKILISDYSGTFTVAEYPPVPYKTFFSALAEKYNRKPKFVNLSFFTISIAIQLAKAFCIKLPVEKENILGLKALQARETMSDLEKLGVRIRTYKESLRNL
jgi:nucleoside-diphosphate-sugar epimerase